ncbi:hypothetical protein ACJMK2_021815 [Sinanodonta woodiana]|uniref:Uncharacterized protein n=1 Tax=Sinanodonta woodiana TaxID=1069815 RepID=A0ABD3THW1_SINWO
MRGKEGNDVQKQKYIDLSFSDELDIEEISVNLPPLDDTGTVNPSVTSQFSEDTSAMRGEEGNNVQKHKYIDLSFSDELDIEEVSVNLPALDDTGAVNPSVTSQFSEDTSAMRGKEGNNVQKRKYIDLSFSDELDMEEPSVKQTTLDDSGTVNPSVTSPFTEDTCAMRAKEGNNVQKRKYMDLSFSDELDMEEPSLKQTTLHDSQTVNSSVTLKVKITSKKLCKVEPSLLVQLLKDLTSRKAKEDLNRNFNEYFNKRRGLCCSKNCCLRWNIWT